MGKKDFFDLENQIKDTLKNTLNSANFSKLRNDINNKAEDAMHEVKENLKYKSRSFNEKINEKIKDKGFDPYKPFNNHRPFNSRPIVNVSPKYKDEREMYITKKPAGSISGIVYIILGFALAGMFGTLLILYSVFTSFLNSLSTINFITLGILIAFFMSSVFLTAKGFNLRKRIKRFKLYAKTLNKNDYCSIDKLSSVVERKPKFIVKDLRKMIDLGMFPEGRIDDNNSYFMLNEEVYKSYLASLESLKRRKEAEFKKQEELREELNNPEKKELRYALELGKNYVNQIKTINSSISREEISPKLNRLENIVGQIFNYLEKNPQKLNEVNKFTNHYLPITLKLVNTYKDLNAQPIQGDNIKNSKIEIEKAIDIINNAFEKLLDDLFREISLDVSTDISVLETLLTQEGLTRNDFKK